MYSHVSMMAIALSGATCAARRRAVCHAMGVQTMRHRLVFPPVLTRDTRRAMARDKPGTTRWTRLGAAWPHKRSKGSRWRGGQQAFTTPLPPAQDGRAAAGASPRTLAIGRKGVPGAQGPVALTRASIAPDQQDLHVFPHGSGEERGKLPEQGQQRGRQCQHRETSRRKSGLQLTLSAVAFSKSKNGQSRAETCFTKSAEEPGGHGGVWPVRVFLASIDLIRVKRLEPGASQ